jgi:Na+/H+ antiporter NhaD/arsenite permease-like protein
MLLIGLAVFAAVYAFLAVPRLGRWIHDRGVSKAPLAWRPPVDWLLRRPGIAIVGAVLVIVLLQVTPRQAWSAIRWDTLALLTGMMLLVAALDAAGAFTRIAAWLVRRLPTPHRLLAGSMVAVAILSALVLNDAVVLFFTPVLVRAARAMRTSPIPFLVAEAFAANIGSAATPVGNPQNATIALARGLDFADYLRAIGPVALIALGLAMVACLFAFRKDLRNGMRVSGVVEPEAPDRRAMMAVAVSCVALALLGSLLGPRLGIPLWASALSAGVLALALAPALAWESPARIARGVDTGILAFFVGLFVLLETVRQSGLLEALAGAVQRHGSGGFVIATAVLSNVVSNVPAVLLLLPGVQSQAQALLLAASSTLAGNATFLGSAATVIVAETARREGADFSVLRFTAVGLPLAAATLALAWLLMT